MLAQLLYCPPSLGEGAEVVLPVILTLPDLRISGEVAELLVTYLVNIITNMNKVNANDCVTLALARCSVACLWSVDWHANYGSSPSSSPPLV